MNKRLRGTGVALITPFLPNGLVDYLSLQRLVDSVIRGGVDFIVVLGSTGETPTLNNKERQEVLDAVLTYTQNAVPVVCGVGGNVTADVIANLNDYDLRAVSAILSVAPYYNKPSQEGLYEHFKAIAKSTNKSIILYNVPGRTGSNLLPDTVLRLAKEFKNIIGIKEASGNLSQCMELVRNAPEDFLILSGDDDLALAHVAIGMHGIISVAANCFPREFTEMMNLAIISKLDKARKIHYRLLPGINMLFAEGNPAGVKATLAHMGMCQNVLRLPLVPVSAKLNVQIGEFVQSLQ